MIELCPIGHAVIKGQTWCCPWCRALKAEAEIAALRERCEKAERERGAYQKAAVLLAAQAEGKPITFLPSKELLQEAEADATRLREENEELKTKLGDVCEMGVKDETNAARLREAIEKAPHMRGCEVGRCRAHALSEKHRCWDVETTYPDCDQQQSCNCWKAAALAGEKP